MREIIKRTRLELAINVLNEISVNPVSLATIYRKTKYTYGYLSDITTLFKNKNFITKEKKGRINYITITDKGVEFHQKCLELNEYGVIL